jgi:hypothetical protein
MVYGPERALLGPFFALEKPPSAYVLVFIRISVSENPVSESHNEL